MSVRLSKACVAFALVAVYLSGCGPDTAGPTVARTGGSAATPALPPRLVLGYSVEGRPIEYQVFGDGPDVVLIMASIHGNEAAGTPLVSELAVTLMRHPELLEARRVVLLPVANPDGVFHNTRYNVHGVDINRNFPAGNWSEKEQHGDAALCEPESRAIYELLQRIPPSRIVTIHQPLACIDYDGPAEALAEAMAAESDLPVRKLGGRPGSLGSYAGLTLGIPIVTVELRRSATGRPHVELWREHGRMLLTAITFPEPPPELIPGEGR
jgi:protein MpaA